MVCGGDVSGFGFFVEWLDGTFKVGVVDLKERVTEDSWASDICDDTVSSFDGASTEVRKARDGGGDWNREPPIRKVPIRDVYVVGVAPRRQVGD